MKIYIYKKRKNNTVDKIKNKATSGIILSILKYKIDWYIDRRRIRCNRITGKQLGGENATQLKERD